VIPRPIGWISTINPQPDQQSQSPNNNNDNDNSNDTGGPGPGPGIGKANLAPFSQFNNLTFDPPCEYFLLYILSLCRRSSFPTKLRLGTAFYSKILHTTHSTLHSP
jgi:hypothetical protein